MFKQPRYRSKRDEHGASVFRASHAAKKDAGAALLYLTDHA